MSSSTVTRRVSGPAPAPAVWEQEDATPVITTPADPRAPGTCVQIVSAREQLDRDVWAAAATRYASADEEHRLYTVQVGENLARPAEAFIHWPWQTLEDLYGPLFPGEIVGLPGYSGHGKSTFLLSLIEELLFDGVPMTYLGLEIKPWHIKVHLACRALRRFGLPVIKPGDVIKGRLSELDKKVIRAAVNWLDNGGWWDTEEEERELGLLFPKQAVGYGRLLRIAPFSAIDARKMRSTFDWCAANGHRLNIIDHIDQVADQRGGAGTRDASVAAMAALHECAQATEVACLYASQLNNEGLKGPGGDPLRIYHPPTPEQVSLGGHKRMVSDGMLGVFKPLLPTPTKADGVGEEDHKARLKAARETRSPDGVVMPWTMGLVVMKDRAYGLERKVGYLRVQPGGRLADMDPDTMATYDRALYDMIDWTTGLARAPFGLDHIPDPLVTHGALAGESAKEQEAFLSHATGMAGGPSLDDLAGETVDMFGL
jgi:hypothetical protein